MTNRARLLLALPFALAIVCSAAVLKGSAAAMPMESALLGVGLSLTVLPGRRRCR